MCNQVGSGGRENPDTYLGVVSIVIVIVLKCRKVKMLYIKEKKFIMLYSRIKTKPLHWFSWGNTDQCPQPLLAKAIKKVYI